MRNAFLQKRLTNRSFLLNSPEKKKFRRIARNQQELLVTANELKSQLRVLSNNTITFNEVCIIAPQPEKFEAKRRRTTISAKARKDKINRSQALEGNTKRNLKLKIDYISDVVKTINYPKWSKPNFNRALWTYDRPNIQRFHKLNKLGQAPTREDSLTDIKAGSFIVVDANSLSPIIARAADSRREIASLTKIFTCYCCILLFLKYEITMSTIARVSERAASINGTSAELQPGDCLTVLDLLHGMMLPSGNDAAMALSQFCGELIYKQIQLKSFQTRRLPPRKSYNRYFLIQLNKLVRELKLPNTFIANPHGLMNYRSFSTSRDVAAVCAVAVHQPTFKQIVATPLYSCTIKNQRTGLTRLCEWKNTNRLLQRGPFFGIKTGVTPSAGPCLASLVQYKKQSIIAILLKTSSLSQRFAETQLLIREVTGCSFQSKEKQDSDFTQANESNGGDPCDQSDLDDQYH